jgi:hypothetical protein
MGYCCDLSEDVKIFDTWLEAHRSAADARIREFTGPGVATRKRPHWGSAKAQYMT